MRSASSFFRSAISSPPLSSVPEDALFSGAPGAGDAGSRTFPVLGSMRRLSRITGPSRSSASSRRSVTLPPNPGQQGCGSRRTAFALVLLVVHDLGVDDLVVLGRVGLRTSGLPFGARLVLGVHRGAHLLADLCELLRARPDRVDVGAFEGLLDLIQRRLDLGLDLGRDLLV